MRIRKLVEMLMAAALVVGAVAIQGDAKTKSKGSTKKSTTSTTSSSSTAIETGKHLDFMGIPINGTISNFSTKLVSKGFEAENNSLPNGCMAFSGSYFDRPAILYVYCIPTTKLVYRVKVVIKCYSEGMADNLMHRLLNAIDDKYDEGDITEGKSEGYDSYSRDVLDWENAIEIEGENGEPEYQVLCIGWIDFFMSYYQEEYRVYIDFFDWENNEKYEEWLKTTI